MKNIFLYLIVIHLFLCSCENTVQTNQNTNTEITHNSYSDYQNQTYKGQLDYLTFENEESVHAFYFKHKIDKLLLDNSSSWKSLDVLFSDDLNPSIKQSLAFDIVSKKDLIGELIKDENNVDLQEKVKKYVSVLVESNYIGYTLLYTCLSQISAFDSDLSSSLAKSISHYSKQKTFHTEIIGNKEMMHSDKTSTIYKKVKEDFQYLSKIKELEK